ncbi:MAG TPA: OsmC family protein [Candidatus Saccharicenans sp.]|jgi:putative redox protein|nr:OsmC family protein [Candidatus Saccharicenans sp.]HRD01704.1 OsmC family protein [Candidatus Saccharicenans sp.]
MSAKDHDNKLSIVADWKNGLAFEAAIGRHRLVMDSVPEAGGKGLGPPPKPLMLVALAGCTGMDVISVLDKMRVVVEKFRITVEGEVTEEHPKQFYKMHVIYEFTGKDLPEDKLKRAIELSQDKYCGVSATYKKALKLTWEMKINS